MILFSDKLTLVTFLCGVLVIIPLSYTVAVPGQTNVAFSTIQPDNQTTVSGTTIVSSVSLNTTKSSSLSASLDIEEDNMNGSLSYDAYLYTESDSRNKTGTEDDLYYNGTDIIDTETYYKYNTTMEEEECDDCFKNKLMHYAGRSTIIVTVLFVSTVLVAISCITYRNIVRLIP